MSEKLQKIGTITVLGEEYDVAKNGNFHLVKAAGEDAYGRPVAHLVVLDNFFRQPGQQSGEHLAAAIRSGKILQAMIDALGEKMVALQAQRDMRRGEAE